MNIKFYSPEKTMKLPLVDQEDYELILWSFGNATDKFVADLHSWLFLDKGRDVTISIENNGKQFTRPINVHSLISKYGLIGYEDFPVQNNFRRFTIMLIHELTAMYLYELNTYRYWIDQRRVFRLSDGHELVKDSIGWVKVREIEDRSIFKTVTIGRTLQEYFKRLGYPEVRGTVNFIYTSYGDDELNEN